MEVLLTVVSFSDRPTEEYTHESISRETLRRWYRNSKNWVSHYKKDKHQYKLESIK